MESEGEYRNEAQFVFLLVMHRKTFCIDNSEGWETARLKPLPEASDSACLNLHTASTVMGKIGTFIFTR